MFVAVALLYLGYSYLLKQWLWLAIAWAFWIISIAGAIYVKMQKPQPYLTSTDEKTGQVIIESYFHDDPREMYAYEGYIVSVTCVLCAMGYILIFNLSKFIENGLLLRILVISILGLALYAQHFITDQFQMKIGRGYKFYFWPEG